MQLFLLQVPVSSACVHLAQSADVDLGLLHLCQDFLRADFLCPEALALQLLRDLFVAEVRLKHVCAGRSCIFGLPILIFLHQKSKDGQKL